MHDMGEFTWAMGPFGWIVMFLFWGLVIFGMLVFVKWLSKVSLLGDKKPLEILQERYARGAIDRQEYAQKKSDLK